MMESDKYGVRMEPSAVAEPYGFSTRKFGYKGTALKLGHISVSLHHQNHQQMTNISISPYHLFLQYVTFASAPTFLLDFLSDDAKHPLSRPQFETG